MKNKEQKNKYLEYFYNLNRWEKIQILSALFLLLLGLVFFYDDIGVLGNIVILVLLILIVPKMLLKFFKYQKIKAIEEVFPVFLQDISEWIKSGLTLQEALKNASRIDYGKLTPEIKKMAIQLSWGIPVQEVLKNFSERLKDSSIIKKSVEIIIESYNSGGNIEETMEAIAQNLSEIKEVTRERKSIMSQHVITIYIIYYVFLGIIAGLSKTLMPMTNISANVGSISMGFTNPCDICKGTFHPACISCFIFNGIAKLFFLGTGIEGYYRGLFFSMLLIQGIFSGLICGELSEGNISSGIRHSLILTISGLGIFMILVRMGVI